MTDPDSRTVTIDVSGDDSAYTSLAALDPADRATMRAALHDLRCSDLYRSMLTTVREAIARHYTGPGATVIGVVFRTSWWGGAHHVGTPGEMVFSDGSVRTHDFTALDDPLTELYGYVPSGFTVALDLETGTFDCSADRHEEHPLNRLSRAGRVQLTEYTTMSPPITTGQRLTPGGFPYRQQGHPYGGSDPDRQSVGDPGHCEDCAAVGHVIAHPDLGCGDVGCTRHHS